jgi:lipopolysaccharide/colanic/teichoic acid biosynthesis glycosyltransferase
MRSFVHRKSQTLFARSRQVTPHNPAGTTHHHQSSSSRLSLSLTRINRGSGISRQQREIHFEASLTWKRALDIGVIILATPVLVPLALLLALFIKFASPGPVLFKQERVGLRGRQFLCLKFRTMVTGADARVHQGHLDDLISANRPMTKLDEADPRLIAGGRALRATGLDELPQIINVLRGEMSLVGPRPCLPYEYARYSARHRRRFETVPGLTGLWQVSGKNKTTFEEMIDLDIHYVVHKSIWLDLKIMAKTIPAIFEQVIETKRKNFSRKLKPAVRQA